MKCEYCGRKLSVIRNLFKKYGFALKMSYVNGKSITETFYYCNEEHKITHFMDVVEEHEREEQNE